MNPIERNPDGQSDAIISRILQYYLAPLISENSRLMALGGRHMSVEEMSFILHGVAPSQVIDEFDKIVLALAAKDSTCD